jgi:hypothetical protein
MDWYVTRNGVQEGPYSEDQMRVIVDQRVLMPTDLVWHAGLSEWTLARNVSGLVLPPVNPLTAPGMAATRSVSRPAPVQIAQPAPTELQAALRKIENTWIASLISAGITLLFVMYSFSGNAIAGIDAWALLDIGAIVGFGYGVHRRSRTCAILLFMLFVIEKLLMFSTGNTAAGIGGAIIFGWLFFQGILGTFRYHAITKMPDALA